MCERTIHTETFFKNGVEYTVSIIKETAQLFGKWECQCGWTGGPSPGYTNQDKCIEDTKFNFEQHYRIKHSSQI